MTETPECLTCSETFHWINPTTGKWRSKLAGRDRKHAEREAARLEYELAKGTYRDLKRIMWREFVTDHVSKIDGARNATEAERTLNEFGQFASPPGPKGVTYGMLEGYVAFLRGEGNEPATVNKKLRYMRSALNRAIKRGYAS